MSKIQIDARHFRRALQATSLIGAGAAATRPVLRTVQFRAEDDALVLVSTSTYTVARCRIPSRVIGDPARVLTEPMLLTLDSVKQILSAVNARARGGVDLSILDGRLVVSGYDFGTLSLGPFEGDFPAAEKLIPARLSRADMVTAVQEIRADRLEELGKLAKLGPKGVPLRFGWSVDSAGAPKFLCAQQEDAVMSHDYPWMSVAMAGHRWTADTEQVRMDRAALIGDQS